MISKKKKRGLTSMQEKMGMNEGSDYMTPGSNSIIPSTAEEGLNERDRDRNVGDMVKDRMTGRK